MGPAESLQVKQQSMGQGLKDRIFHGLLAGLETETCQIASVNDDCSSLVRRWRRSGPEDGLHVPAQSPYAYPANP